MILDRLFNMDYWLLVLAQAVCLQYTGNLFRRREVLFTNKNGDFDEVSGTKRDCSATILRVDRKDRTKVELYLIDHFIV